MINSNDKTSQIHLIMKAFLLFPVLTVIQGISIFESINKIWMVFSMLLLILSFKNLKYQKKDFMILFLTIVLHVIALIFTKEAIYNINTTMYLIIWVMFYIFIAKYKDDVIDFLYNDEKYLKIILKIWTIIVGTSMLFRKSYDSSGYFMSFTSAPFRLMPTVLVIIALIFFLYKKSNNKKYLFYLIIPTFCAFMGYSRTYFAIYIILITTFFYSNSKNKIKFYMGIIPLSIIIIYFISISNIGDKIASTSYTSDSYLDFWGTITSGRSIFWSLDLQQFFRLPFIKQLVGNGYNFVYNVNSLRGSKIWAHNDFINILMNFGYFGIVVYAYAFKKIYNSILKNNKSFFIKFLLSFVVFFNSMLNMSYTYLCSFLSYPLLFIVLDNLTYEKRSLDI